MNNKLPKVFANPIDKNIKVNQESTLASEKVNDISIEEILDDKNKYLFNHKYKITLKDNKVIESSIISKMNNNLLTIDGDKINILDIKSIIEIKK